MRVLRKLLDAAREADAEEHDEPRRHSLCA